MAKIVGAIIVVAVGIAVFVALHHEDGGGARSGGVAPPASKGSAPVPRGSLTPEAVLSIAPRAREGVTAPAPPLSPAVREYQSARSFASTYARLKDSSARTPEEQWLLAEILQKCASVSGDPPFARGTGTFGPEARARFVASLAPNDPDRERRIAAFDRVDFDTCDGLHGLKTTRKDIRAAYEAGAAAGDAKSRARLVGADLEAQTIGPDGKEIGGKLPSISDAQLDTLRQAMASGDPVAMREVVSLLAMDYDNMSLRDANDRPVDHAAFLRAMAMYACEAGEECGPDSHYLAYFCAWEGQCDAQTVRDYMMYYALSPSSSQVVASYEDGLRRARNGDWSFFHFYRGPLPSQAVMKPPGKP